MPGLFERLTAWLGGRVETTPQAKVGQAPAGPSVEPDDSRLPDTSRPRVARLLSLIADIEARSRDEAMLVSAFTEVLQMRDVHLPQLVASYADIPAAHRTEIFRKTGRSASYNLDAAFDRMIVRLETLSRTMAQDDLDGFTDNLRFIEHRYGSEDPAG